MQKYKALISYELRQVRWLILYFCLGFILLGKQIEMNVQRDYIKFLRFGIGQFSYVNNDFTKMLNEVYSSFLFFMLLGMIILIYRQFRDSKSAEIGVFLKSLPIKNQKHFLVKISCGTLCFTIPFVLYSVYLLVLKGQHMGWMGELYSMTGLRRPFEVFNSNSYALKILLMYYLLMSFTYLFLVMMQYMVNHMVGSIVVSSIIALIPIYLVEAFKIIKWQFIKEFGADVFWSFSSHYLPWIYPNKISSLVDEQSHSFLSGITSYVEYIPNLYMFLAILIILNLICLVGGYFFSKFFKVEMAEHIFSKPVFEYIFIIGVIICCALLPLIIYYFVGITMIYISFNVLLLLGIPMGIFGGLIAYKITKIGRSS